MVVNHGHAISIEIQEGRKHRNSEFFKYVLCQHDIQSIRWFEMLILKTTFRLSAYKQSLYTSFILSSFGKTCSEDGSLNREFSSLFCDPVRHRKCFVWNLGVILSYDLRYRRMQRIHLRFHLICFHFHYATMIAVFVTRCFCSACVKLKIISYQFSSYLLLKYFFHCLKLNSVCRYVCQWFRSHSKTLEQ